MEARPRCALPRIAAAESRGRPARPPLASLLPPPPAHLLFEMLRSTAAARRAIPGAHTQVSARRFAHKVRPRPPHLLPPLLSSSTHLAHPRLTATGAPLRQRGPSGSPLGRRHPRKGRLGHPRTQGPQRDHRAAVRRAQGPSSLLLPAPRPPRTAQLTRQNSHADHQGRCHGRQEHHAQGQVREPRRSVRPSSLPRRPSPSLHVY